MTGKNLISLCEKIVQEKGFLFIEAVVRGSGSIPVIEVYMDSPNPLTIDDCALVSRELQAVLEETKAAGENFRLDVSSPGIDRSLKYIEQYRKHTGSKFEVVCLEGQEKKKFSGRLKEITGSNLIFELKNGQTDTVPFESIESALVKISFNKGDRQ